MFRGRRSSAHQRSSSNVEPKHRIEDRNSLNIKATEIDCQRHGNKNDDVETPSPPPRPLSSSDNTTLIRKAFNGFASLRGSPPELYRAYAIKFLDSYAYFSYSIVCTLFLSDEFGFTDVQAGAIYGAWGTLITVYGLLIGFVVDSLGVARSLRYGLTISLLGRTGVLFATSSRVLMFHMFVTMPLGNCLGIPVLTTAVRRYTNESNRGFAFGLFYVIMNVSVLLAGPTVDILTTRFDGASGGGEPLENNNSWSMTKYRAILATGVVGNLAACLVSLWMREIKVNGDVAGTVSNFSPTGGSFTEIMNEITRAPSFRRFLGVCFITLNVKMIFRHLDATLPKYMVREFGEDVPKGTIYSINPTIVILLVPIVTAATTDVPPLQAIHFGTYVSAASVFFLVASTSVSACVAFVVVLSVGEAIWSPRLYDYAMSICREGREGTFMALSSAPLFLAKFPVGILSGWLLETYCPEEGLRRSRTMWLIIGLMTATSPVLLTVFRGYLSKKDRDDRQIQISNEIS